MKTNYWLKYLNNTLRYQYSHIKYRKKFNELRKAEGKYSMKGFDNLNCIYIHIPKTGGVSVNKAIFGNFGGGHKDVKFYKRVFGPVTYQRYFTFTFVRNPYSRLYSAFHFLKRGGFGGRDKTWSDENLAGYITFEQFVNEWLSEENVFTYTHFIPQHAFVCDINLVPDVDFIGRMESFDEDFQQVADRLHLSVKLPFLNKTDTSDWEVAYNREMLEKVGKIYKDDFTTFGYDLYRI